MGGADSMELSQLVGVPGLQTCWVGRDSLVIDLVIMSATGHALRAGRPVLERAAVRSPRAGARLR